MGRFFDGLTNFVNSLANRRKASAQNRIENDYLSWADMNEIYKTGLGNKIVRIKSGDALSPNALAFDRQDDEDFFNARLARKLRETVVWQLAFGRAVVVIQQMGDKLSSPLSSNLDPKKLVFRVFSGDMITTYSPDVNLESPRYLMPEWYYIRGTAIHHTRVVDFTYIRPRELELPLYQYGGISEFELIYQQLVNDGVIERASASIVEKSSSLFYKVQGYKEKLAQNKVDELLKFFQIAEDQRSIYGAGIIDAEDDVVTTEQKLQNLAEVDQISLRRVAMVTGLSITRLVGENVRGLNSSGETERLSDKATIDALRNDYVLPPLQELLTKVGCGKVYTSDNWSETPGEKVDFEQKVLKNAAVMFDLGQDYEKYLQDHGLIQKDAWDEVFPDDDFEDPGEEPELEQGKTMEQMAQEIMGEGDNGAEESQE